ncbi:MAG: hypothetical protein JOS17DRAFT_778823 [Linnemannia elongata]|nr:MAG: hypothetical protein JOS17DRAFT_778823 [Linnemannia elongata]
MALQAECRLTVSPFSVPALGSLYTRHNLLGHICRLLVDRGITFLSPTSVVDATRLIGPLLPPGVYPKVAHQLFLDGVASLDEVVSEDGLSLASWTELRERLALKNRVRRWYTALVDAVCLRPVIPAAPATATTVPQVPTSHIPSPTSELSNNDAPSMDSLLERRQAVDAQQTFSASVITTADPVDESHAHSLAPSEVGTSVNEPSEDELLLDPRRARHRRAEEANEVATIAVNNVDETILLGLSEVVDSLQVRSTASTVIPAAAAGNEGGGDGNEEESEDRVTALSPATSARALGVWFSADGKGKHTRQLVHQELTTMCEILSRKAVTDKQAIYIFNNVFLPRIQYRLSVTILSDTEINAIVSRYAGVVKQKVELAHGTPLSILFHRRLYGLRHLGDAQIEEQVSTAQLRLNDHSLLGKVVTTRAMALQAECRLTVSPFSVPALGSLYTRHNLLGHICRLLVDRGITFLSPTSVVDATRLIGPLLPPGVYPKVAHQLFLDGVASLDEVVSEDGLSLASWTELRERLALKNRVRRWYTALVDAVCLRPVIPAAPATATTVPQVPTSHIPSPTSELSNNDAPSMDSLLERRQAVDAQQTFSASVITTADPVDESHAHSLAPSEVGTSVNEPSEDELLLDPRRARHRRAEEANEVATIAVNNVDETILLGLSEVVDSLQVRSTASTVIPAAAAGNEGGGDGNEEEKKEKGQEALRENRGFLSWTHP